jgi:hypothetical protein
MFVAYPWIPPPYTPGMTDEPTARPFAWWWLGGFSGAGAIVAGAVGAMLDLGFLASLGIAVLGAIAGLSVGLGVAEAVVLIADSLGWDERPQTSRAGRIARRMDQVIDEAGF